MRTLFVQMKSVFHGQLEEAVTQMEQLRAELAGRRGGAGMGEGAVGPSGSEESARMEVPA